MHKRRIENPIIENIPQQWDLGVMQLLVLRLLAALVLTDFRQLFVSALQEEAFVAQVARAGIDLFLL